MNFKIYIKNYYGVPYKYTNWFLTYEKLLVCQKKNELMKNSYKLIDIYEKVRDEGVFEKKNEIYKLIRKSYCLKKFSHYKYHFNFFFL